MSGTDQLLWPGKVTQVIDPHYFWMQLGTKEALYQFDQLQDEMQQFGMYNWTHVSDVDQLEHGQVVLIDTEAVDDNARWKRGQVARMTSGNSVDVFYVDFGNTELTTVDKICAKFPQQYRSCPPQAVRCSLSGVRPISKNWTSRGTKTFQTAISGHKMNALVMYGEPGYCEVSLYPSDVENGRSVSHQLLDEDVAMPIEDRTVPEFVEDIPSFMATLMSQDCNTSLKVAEDPAVSQESQYIASTNEGIPPTKPSNIAPPYITSNNATPTNNTNTSNNTPPANNTNNSKPVVEKYIPPIPPSRKNNLDTCHGSPGAYNLGSSPGSGSNHGSSSSYNSSGSPSSVPHLSKSPLQKPLSLNTNLKTKAQLVVDFFPFDNVSTYPPTPVSPIKSPTKSSGYPPPGFAANQESEYYSRSPSKYNHSEPNYSDGHSQGYKVSEGNVGYNRGRNFGKDNYYKDSRPSGRYNRQSDHHTPEKNRFAANFNNLPNHGRGDYKITSSAAANFEPSYLNSSSEKSAPHLQQHSSPVKNYSSLDRTKSGSKFCKIPDQHSSESESPSPLKVRPPFYPPKLSNEDLPPMRNTTLTPPHFYKKTIPTSQNYDNGTDLTPPGYYKSHQEYSQGNQSSPSYSNPELETMTSPTKQYQHGSGEQSHHYKNHYNGHNHNRQNYTDYPNHQYYDGYSHHSKYFTKFEENRSNDDSSNNINSNYDNKMTHPVVNVNLPETSSKCLVQDYPSKLSPVSPESPGIAGFNLGEIDHTQHTSTAELHQHMYQEKLAALQEEAEDIAIESKEQSALNQMSRYGAKTEEEGGEYQHSDSPDIYEQIAAEISYTTKHSPKEYDELRKSPIKRTWKSPECERAERPVKIEEIPASYIADIDFALAVKEALEFGKTDGMENVKGLLDDIVESLKAADVEKQLYDVLLLLLAKSIQEYNLYHVLVMDTVNALNGELEIKDCLARVLKRQQELCIRVPVSKTTCHLDFSRVIGHVYNMSLEWSDSNASIQDAILVTVEKWVLFNNKGSQIGQTDKENVFLDCFAAFWEVSGMQLLQHNNDFRSRIHNEIRRKLLNESVSRSIRERLLDILMDLFSVSVERTEAYTQTPRRTMIPSSCQVKPCTCDKETMTKLDWREDEQFTDYDPDSSIDTRWFAASDFVSSPDPGISLRPRGKSYEHKVSSTPQDSFTSPTTSEAACVGTPTNTSSFVQELLYASNASVSVYATPNESLTNDADIKANVNNSNISVLDKSEMVDQSKQTISSGANTSQNYINNADVKIPTTAAVYKDKSMAGVATSGRSQGDEDILESVAEKKSAVGKSIVDWFDYEPETTNNSNSVGAKLEEKRLESKKKLNSTSVEMMENKVAQKFINNGAVGCGSDIGPRVKTSKKNRKSKKSSPKTEVASSSRLRNVEESKTSPDKLEKDFDNVVLPVVPLETEMETDVEINNKAVKDVDWWGVGGPLEPPHAASSIKCDIFTDTGPDVIIEEEFDELNVESCKGDEIGNFDHDLVADDILNEDKVVIQTGQESQAGTQLIQSADRMEPGQNNNLPDTTDVLRFSGPVKMVVDEFGFNDSDIGDYDDWETDSNSGSDIQKEVPGQPSKYEEEFPESDLKEPLIHVPNSSSAPERTYQPDTHKNKNFQKTNLADFIPASHEGEYIEREKATRWVPNKRKCLTCYDDDHTTENCPKGFVLL